MLHSVFLGLFVALVPGLSGFALRLEDKTQRLEQAVEFGAGRIKAKFNDDSKKC